MLKVIYNLLLVWVSHKSFISVSSGALLPFEVHEHAAWLRCLSPLISGLHYASDKATIVATTNVILLIKDVIVNIL